MKTNQQTKVNAVFLQTLTSAVSDLKNRLQQDYEQAYPGLAKRRPTRSRRRRGKGVGLVVFPALVTARSGRSAHGASRSATGVP